MAENARVDGYAELTLVVACRVFAESSHRTGDDWKSAFRLRSIAMAADASDFADVGHSWRRYCEPILATRI